MTSSLKNITISRALIKKQEGIAILPLEEYERIKEELEMLRSKSLAKHVTKARKEAGQGKVLSLKDVGVKLNL